MKFINLKLLKRIRLETLHHKQLIHTFSLDTTARGINGFSDETYVMLYCRHLQAENLLEQLTKLYEMAKDFAVDNLESERKSWLDFYGEDGEPFEPFGTLEYCFADGTAYQLPEHISQYKELLYYVNHFTIYVEAKEKVFDQLFGNMDRFIPATDASGNREFINQRDLSPDQQEQLRLGDIVKEMNDLDAEYSLVNYDEFYATCRQLFETYRPTGDYISCAAQILALFA